MDTVTHALSAAMFFIVTGTPEFIPLGILGAIILDIDVVFKLIADSYPSLFILGHGGVTHSILGAVILAILVFSAVKLSSRSSFVRERFPTDFTIIALFATVVGAFLHLLLDFLAYPGIPLLFPWSMKRYTLGLFPGPSLFLMVASVIFLVLFVFHRVSLVDMKIYAAIFAIVVLISLGMKWYVATTKVGTTIPTLNPFQWLIMNDNGSAYSVEVYSIVSGTTKTLYFGKFKNVTPDEISKFENVPEFQRFQYYSYIVTAEKNGTAITFHDPLREQGLLFYPPYYANFSVTIPQ